MTYEVYHCSVANLVALRKFAQGKGFFFGRHLGVSFADIREIILAVTGYEFHGKETLTESRNWAQFAVHTLNGLSGIRKIMNAKMDSPIITNTNKTPIQIYAGGNLNYMKFQECYLFLEFFYASFDNTTNFMYSGW